MASAAETRTLGITKGDLTEVVDEMRLARRLLRNRNIERSPEDWSIYNSPHTDYERYFGDFGITFAEILAYKKDPVVVDLLSSHAAIESLFSEMGILGEAGTGISVSLADPRPLLEKYKDKRMGITHVAGNLGSPTTWKKLERALRGRKADLVMERGWGALAYLPAHPLFYLYAAQKIWGMLSENGGTFVGGINDQHMLEFSHINKWTKHLRAEEIDVEFQTVPRAIKLVKHPDSPARLPLPTQIF